MNQNGGIHKGGFAVLCHRNGGSESPGILTDPDTALFFIEFIVTSSICEKEEIFTAVFFYKVLCIFPEPGSHSSASFISYNVQIDKLPVKFLPGLFKHFPVLTVQFSEHLQVLPAFLVYKKS